MNYSMKVLTQNYRVVTNTKGEFDMTVNHSIKALEQEEARLTDDLDVLNSINARDGLRQETIAKLRNVRASILVLKDSLEKVNNYTKNGGFFFSNNGEVLITGDLKVTKVNTATTDKEKQELNSLVNDLMNKLKKLNDVMN